LRNNLTSGLLEILFGVDVGSISRVTRNLAIIYSDCLPSVSFNNMDYSKNIPAHVLEREDVDE